MDDLVVSFIAAGFNHSAVISKEVSVIVRALSLFHFNLVRESCLRLEMVNI